MSQGCSKEEGERSRGIGDVNVHFEAFLFPPELLLNLEHDVGEPLLDVNIGYIRAF